MKKSELKALIREVIEEMHSKTGFISHDINKMTGAGLTKQPDGSFYLKGGYNNGVSINTSQVPDTFEVSWSSEYEDGDSVEVRGIDSAIEKALEQL